MRNLRNLIKRTDITGRTSDREPYLVRWSIELPRGWGLKLHKILKPDYTECKHDHPWWFLVLILRGGYTEKNEDGIQQLRPGRFYFRHPEFQHQIQKLHRTPSWSLVLTGPKVRKWGFVNEDGDWRQFEEFTFLMTDEQQINWCE